MGSFSRLYDKLKKRDLVSEHDLTDVTYAIELLEHAGDDLSDIMFMWHSAQQSKASALHEARLHIAKLQKALDRIEFAK